MSIFAIADLHLSLGNPEKMMDFFGEPWIDYTEKIENHWRSLVSEQDLVLIPGDISWAMHPESALIDLEWIDKLPGQKVLIRGNHDYWWSSLSKVQKVLPPSLHLIQNNAFHWNGVSIGGARLWDSSEYKFADYIDYVENPKAKKLSDGEILPDADKIFERELMRLESSLKSIKQTAELKIAMTHYPPIGAALFPSKASSLLQKYGVEVCVFGHLHNVRQGALSFGKAQGIDFHLVSADFLNFIPLKIA